MSDRAERLAQMIADEGPELARRSAEHDSDNSFVAENYALLKEHGMFSALVPEDLGGGGVSHSEMCELLRQLGRHCGSTALAVSMHQHLVAATVWKHRRGEPGQALLEKVAANELVLVSTGGRDWLGSNGEVTRVDGGYRVSAYKVFASGSPAGAMLMTSAPYEDPDDGWQVLHFALPFSADGVRIDENWDAHGMRGTGSHTVVLDGVFVPDDGIALRRPRGTLHPAWNVIIGVALPLIGSAYLGVAEAAAEIGRRFARKSDDVPLAAVLLGEMENELTMAQIAHESAVALANDYDFSPSAELSSAILARKTILAGAARRCVEKATEVSGGPGFFRSVGLERMLRDIRAMHFHPLPEKKQHLFTGRLSLGLDPIDLGEGTSDSKKSRAA